MILYIIGHNILVMYLVHKNVICIHKDMYIIGNNILFMYIIGNNILFMYLVHKGLILVC